MIIVVVTVGTVVMCDDIRIYTTIYISHTATLYKHIHLYTLHTHYIHTLLYTHIYTHPHIHTHYIHTTIYTHYYTHTTIHTYIG